jgi:fido (protein-threonine AMPylation protein)
LTRHQDTTTAVDQFGNRLEIPLLKGQFKEQPNNPRRPDGSTHEYCPPLHVGSEVDNLLSWFGEYKDEDPVIVAAWLHHRFTQIHPYQDGNGRVARALTTLVLLRSDLLPLVIDRDLRTEYISALEEADRGELKLLASLLARLERSAILEALSIDIDTEIAKERALTSAVLQSLAAKFSKRKEVKHKELRGVNSLAEQLRLRTRKVIGRAFNELKRTISPVVDSEIYIRDGGPDCDNAHWFKYEVVKSGNEAGKHVNFDEAHYFIKASIRAERERLVLVVSLHHVGRELSGVMEATAFARLESFEDSEDREYVSQDFFLCSLEPFVFTYKTQEGEIANSYDRWLDTALAVAIKEYGDRL